jgi:hypothetical protein
MKSFDILAFIQETKRLIALIFLSISAVGVVLILDSAGGPLSALLGVIALSFAARLLYLSSIRLNTLSTSLSDQGDVPISPSKTEMQSPKLKTNNSSNSDISPPEVPFKSSAD